jgi:hypothetical protein
LQFRDTVREARSSALFSTAYVASEKRSTAIRSRAS